MAAFIKTIVFLVVIALLGVLVIGAVGFGSAKFASITQKYDPKNPPRPGVWYHLHQPHIYDRLMEGEIRKIGHNKYEQWVQYRTVTGTYTQVFTYDFEGRISAQRDLDCFWPLLKLE